MARGAHKGAVWRALRKEGRKEEDRGVGEQKAGMDMAIVELGREEEKDAKGSGMS